VGEYSVSPRVPMGQTERAIRVLQEGCVLTSTQSKAIGMNIYS
jgi:hypothetical protein